MYPMLKGLKIMMDIPSGVPKWSKLNMHVILVRNLDLHPSTGCTFDSIKRLQLDSKRNHAEVPICHVYKLNESLLMLHVFQLINKGRILVSLLATCWWKIHKIRNNCDKRLFRCNNYCGFCAFSIKWLKLIFHQRTWIQWMNQSKWQRLFRCNNYCGFCAFSISKWLKLIFHQRTWIQWMN